MALPAASGIALGVAAGTRAAAARPSRVAMCVLSVHIRRAEPGDDVQVKKLASLLMRSFYGEFAPSQGPVAWMQRGIIESDVVGDLSGRLKYYEEARERLLPHVGAIFVAEAGGEVCGFADVGVSLYDAAKRQFRLPKRPEGVPPPATFEGSSELREQGETWTDAAARPAADAPTQLRVYVSNLAVEESQRRRGAGRQLVAACEAEARTWAVEHVEPEVVSEVWLEVSRSNEAAVAFYARLGYELAEFTSGREVVKRRWSFEAVDVKRGLMRKVLSRADGPLAGREPVPET